MSFTNCNNWGPRRTVDTNTGDSENNQDKDEMASRKSGGKLNRAPFYNFLRMFGMENKQLTSTEVAIQGREKWRLMGDTDKLMYKKGKFTLPKREPQNQPRRSPIKSLKNKQSSQSRDRFLRNKRNDPGGFRTKEKEVYFVDVGEHANVGKMDALH